MRTLIIYKKTLRLFRRICIASCIALFVYAWYLTFGVDIELNLMHTVNTPNNKVGINNIKSASVNINHVGSLTNNLGVSKEGTQKLNISLEKYDYRARVFDLYFKKNNSPLYGFGSTFVSACDKYGAPSDCTLLLGIGKVETNLCTTGGSLAQHNCWGYGGSGPNRIKYNDFNQAINDVTSRLMSGYGKNFFIDPEIGELYYCGPHCNTWGDKVKVYQNEIKAFAKTNGYTL